MEQTALLAAGSRPCRGIMTGFGGRAFDLNDQSDLTGSLSTLKRLAESIGQQFVGALRKRVLVVSEILAVGR